jgi:putative sugar O-methyltransferase
MTARTDTGAYVAARAEAMQSHIEAHAGLLAPGAFWREYAEADLDTLRAEGFSTFKRTLNAHYFQFLVQDTQSAFGARLRQEWLRHPDPRVFAARRIGDDLRWIPEGRNRRLRSRTYARNVAVLWDHVRRRAGGALADSLQEPDLGRPVLVRHRGQRVSQDLANSLHEFCAVREVVPTAELHGARYMEIGAGYGRLADMFLRLVPDIRVVIVDIAPALAISEEYLTRRFPERRALRWAPVVDAGELDAAELAFLTPDQLAAADPLRAQLCVNVSSLHEMPAEQADLYLQLIDRHCDGWFFTKQWERWTNTHDEVEVARDRYAYPPHWRVIFERPTSIVPDFFEAVYAL